MFTTAAAAAAWEAAVPQHFAAMALQDGVKSVVGAGAGAGAGATKAGPEVPILVRAAVMAAVERLAVVLEELPASRAGRFQGAQPSLRMEAAALKHTVAQAVAVVAAGVALAGRRRLLALALPLFCPS